MHLVGVHLADYYCTSIVCEKIPVGQFMQLTVESLAIFTIRDVNVIFDSKVGQIGTI